MQKLFKIIIWLAAGSTSMAWASTSLPQGEAIIGQHHYHVDIANTPETQAQGLSGRQALAKNQGMFFTFPDTAPRQFWMKEMHFPLDIVWIKDHTITAITADVPAPPPHTPLNELLKYPSPQPVNKVLELPAGTTATDGIKVGDTVVLAVKNDSAF